MNRIALAVLVVLVSFLAPRRGLAAPVTLHAFKGPDGRDPHAGLILGTDGNFYGTTAGGGTGVSMALQAETGLGAYQKVRAAVSRGAVEVGKKALTQYAHTLKGQAARKKLDDPLRETFLADGEAIVPDVTQLRAELACPADAAP